jgi:hypothetical protein
MGVFHSLFATADKPIADRWALRTKEDWDHKLTEADINVIVGPLFAGGRKIKENEGDALIWIFEQSKFTPAGMKRLQRFFDEADLLDRWKLVRLTGAALRPIDEALSNDVVGQIVFKSPGTFISYAPFDYEAIRRLIARGDIMVFETRAGGASRLASSRGDYNSNSNRLTIHEFVDKKLRTALIVHEVTHAIQDWKDDRSLRRAFEADAFIAEGVVKRTLIGTPDKDDRNLAIIDRAALCVLQGNATGGKEWHDAYNGVIEVMAQFYDNDRPKEAKEAKVESAEYRSVVSGAEVSWLLQEGLKKSVEEYRKALAKFDLAKYARQ